MLIHHSCHRRSQCCSCAAIPSLRKRDIGAFEYKKYISNVHIVHLNGFRDDLITALLSLKQLDGIAVVRETDGDDGNVNDVDDDGEDDGEDDDSEISDGNRKVVHTEALIAAIESSRPLSRADGVSNVIHQPPASAPRSASSANNTARASSAAAQSSATTQRPPSTKRSSGLSEKRQSNASDAISMTPKPPSGARPASGRPTPTRINNAPTVNAAVPETRVETAHSAFITSGWFS